MLSKIADVATIPLKLTPEGLALTAAKFGAEQVGGMAVKGLLNHHGAGDAPPPLSQADVASLNAAGLQGLRASDEGAA